MARRSVTKSSGFAALSARPIRASAVAGASGFPAASRAGTSRVAPSLAAQSWRRNNSSLRFNTSARARIVRPVCSLICAISLSVNSGLAGAGRGQARPAIPSTINCRTGRHGKALSVKRLTPSTKRSDPVLAFGRAAASRKADVQSGASSFWPAPIRATRDRKSRLASRSGRVAAIACKRAIMRAVVATGRKASTRSAEIPSRLFALRDRPFSIVSLANSAP